MKPQRIGQPRELKCEKINQTVFGTVKRSPLVDDQEPRELDDNSKPQANIALLRLATT